jgi:hypothetical protein
MSAISTVCDRVLVINKGKPIFLGNPEEAINIYTSMLRTSQKTEDARIILQEANIKDGNGNNRLVFEPGEKCSVSLSFKSVEEFKNINIGIRLRKKENSYVVFGSHYTALTGNRIAMNKGQDMKITFDLSLNLSQGVYAIEAIAWNQLRNCPLLVKEIDTLIIKDVIKTDGIAFLNPQLKEISLS